MLGWRTSEFPAFFTRSSGLPVDHRVESIDQLARIIRTKWDLGLVGGVLVANPIAPEHEPDPAVIDTAIETAVQEAQRQGIVGKQITPYLLRRVDELTAGLSLRSNVELVRANARLAGALAVALCQPTRTATLPK